MSRPLNRIKQSAKKSAGNRRLLQPKMDIKIASKEATKKKGIKEIKGTKGIKKASIRSNNKNSTLSANPRSEKLELWIKAIQERYASDPTLPGIHIAYIPPRNEFYVAIHRFKQEWGNGKFVTATPSGKTLNGFAPTLIEAIKIVFDLWRAAYIPSFNATKALQEYEGDF